MKLKPTSPSVRQTRKEIIRKWRESGLLDGLTLLNLETFSLEENIRHYDFKYNEAVEYLFSPEIAKEALIKSMLYRVKKIKRDHCE